jgi:hypothetical protein
MESRLGRLMRLVKKAIVAAVLGLSLTSLDFLWSQENAAQPKDQDGLILNDPKAFSGYTLFSPLNSTKTFLIDMQGKVVKTWQGASTPCGLGYLLPNGNILRPCHPVEKKQTIVAGTTGPNGGRIQEFTWDGELVFDMMAPADKFVPHHDIVKLTNGNYLVVAGERKTIQEVTAAGRRVPGGLRPDCVFEVKPTSKTTWEIVWEWHVWDHLIQESDPAKPNYGEVAAHPGRIDVNYGLGFTAANPKELEKLKSLGYVGGTRSTSEDWNHINCISYNAALDQIMLSVRSFHEVWIIDHSTTTAEAAGSTGGRYGKGGDLLYRWGNPVVYHAAKVSDQQLFGQHNTHWIPPGLPGEGNMLVFNNGNRRPGGESSSVDELVLPVDAQGRYTLKPGTAFGPDKPVWSYAAPNKTDFYSFYISGAQRLPNGNTLICSGAQGTFFEVTPDKEIVWKYISPLRVVGGAPAAAKANNPRGSNSVFRAYRYAPDYAGLAGKNLTPGKTVEEILKDEKDKENAK